MTRIILDQTSLNRLRAANDVVQVCDETGAVVGTFVPVIDDVSAVLSEEPLLSIAELKRRSAEPGGRPLSDILADLKRKHG
jgi:hypothetical protein